MNPKPTAVLCHTQQADTHYDWLLPDPADPAGRLWTARVAIHPMHWQRLATWTLTPIPPHRRAYLTYQGPVSANRGHVTRVDEGRATILDWQSALHVVSLHTRWLNATVALRPLSPTLWQARIL